MRNATNYPKEIEIGGLKKEDLFRKVLNGNFSIYAPNLVGQDIVVSPEKKTIKLNYKSVAEMGFTEQWTKLTDVKNWIKKNCSAELCDHETVFWLRLAFCRNIVSWTYIATKPISVGSDEPYIFHYWTEWLYFEVPNSNFVCDLNTIFVFTSEN